MKPAIFLSLFIASMTATTAMAAGDAARGKAKSAPCATCHGVDGNSVNPEWPKIAGQSAQYIYRQLQMFKQRQRINPLMNPQAAILSEQDMHDLAAYYESQTPSLGTADKRLVKMGETIYRGGNLEEGVPACISCHGPRGSGNPPAGYPRLSYQHARYISKRLYNYRDGKETYPGSEIMSGVVKRLSDEEIEAVSSYVQGLH